jgi:hypothetical protein
MPDEMQAPLTGDAPPAAPAADEWTPPTREEWEAINGKYGKLQKDLEKHRTRAEQVEAEKAAAEAERLKNAPLEEQLNAERERRAELEAMLSEREEAAHHAELDRAAEAAGVPERLREPARDAWARDLDAMLEAAGIDPDDDERIEQAVADGELELFDFDEWLELEDNSVFRAAGNAAPKPPTAPGVPTGAAKAMQSAVNEMSKEEFASLQKRVLLGERVQFKR